MNLLNSVNSNSARGAVAVIYNKVPNAPQSLVYILNSATQTSVQVSFTSPTNTAVSSYTSSVGSGSGTPSSYTIGSLTSNTSYSLTVRANSIYGKAGTSSGAITILTLASAPSISSVSITSVTAVSISFLPPPLEQEPLQGMLSRAVHQSP